MIMKSNINKLVCILCVHLSSISLETFKDRALKISEILELIKLHTYKFSLVYIPPHCALHLGPKPKRLINFKNTKKLTTKTILRCTP